MKTVWLFPRNLFRFHHACDEGREKNQKQASVWKWFHVIIAIASARLNGNSIAKLLIAIAESWGCGLWLIWKCIICVVHGTLIMRSFSLPRRFNPLDANPSRVVFRGSAALRGRRSPRGIKAQFPPKSANDERKNAGAKNFSRLKTWIIPIESRQIPGFLFFSFASEWMMMAVGCLRSKLEFKLTFCVRWNKTNCWLNQFESGVEKSGCWKTFSRPGLANGKNFRIENRRNYLLTFIAGRLQNCRF